VMLVCVRDQFSAAHKLPKHPKCGKTHGHNYTVEVKIKIPSALGHTSETIHVDFATLKDALKDVLSKFDHYNLNDLMSYPTAENIAKFIYWHLQEQFDVSEVKVHETDKYWVELRPEED